MSEPAPTVGVIVVAAGTGVRLGADIPKAFVPVAGRTILERSLRSVTAMADRAQIVVVVPLEWLVRAQAICASVATASVTTASVTTASVTTVQDEITVVAGGASRQASVVAGLAVLDDAVSIVLVHDAARALTPGSQFDRIVAQVRRSAAGAIPGLAVADTIKRIDAAGVVSGTVDRSELSAVQTPQGFPRAQLDAAYAAATAEATDDAALVAAIGLPVTVIDGDPLAFKITTPWDLRRAEQIIAERLGAEQSGTVRVGIGTDTHAFDPDAELWLAGLHWPGEPGLAGHSDGDVVAHAIVDALLSAAGLGDIGGVFGTADPRFEGAHGDVFLRETRRRVEDAGFRIGNVAVQLVGIRPRFSPRRDEAQKLLAGILGGPVSVSSTTTDSLGFAGRGEGIAAIATALLHSGR